MPKPSLAFRLLLALVGLLLTSLVFAAPAFTIIGIGDESIPENTEYTSQAPLTDGTTSGTVTYSLINDIDVFSVFDIPMFSGMNILQLVNFYLMDDSELFTISNSNGIVSMVPRDFEDPDDSNQDNVYAVTIVATDSAGNRNAASWHVTLLNLPPASFSLTGIISNKSVYENTAYTYPAPGISGTTSGSVTYYLSGPDRNLFTVNSSTGTMQFSGQDYENPQDSNNDNIYEVRLTGTDADDNSAWVDLQVTILNMPPLTYSMAPIVADIDEHQNWSVLGPAINGSFRAPLQFQLSGADAAHFSLGADGSVSLPRQNWEAPADTDANNVYEAILTATDIDANIATTTIAVTVLDIPFDPEKDDDLDGVINMVEIAEQTDPYNNAHFRDFDHDGIPDAMEFDADNDTLLNTIDNNGHAPYTDHDGDYVPDYLDASDRGDGTLANCSDSNSDLICDYGDRLDPLFDPDQDNTPSHADIDSDNDFLPDIIETSFDHDGDSKPGHYDIDSDNDGIPDVVESGTFATDTDSDGIADLFDVTLTGGLDANGDGIDDGVGAADFDADGSPDYLDSDADNDNIPDALEGSDSQDSDLDGIDDAYDVNVSGGFDANNDGISDSFIRPDTDHDMRPDFLDTDSDNDGIADRIESGAFGTDANANGIDDFFDATASVGTDNNLDSILENRFPDTDSDGRANHQDLDSDNDGITDVDEAGGRDDDKNGLYDLAAVYASPLPDTDLDNQPDMLDTDSNNDGVLDIAETAFAALDANLDGHIDISIDPDRDGIDSSADNAPAQFGLQPLDSDSDGISDNLDNDKDGDSISNADEGTDDKDNDNIPNNLDADSDNDGISDYNESGTPQKTGDLNHNGIDDSVDAVLTLGPDADLDGLDDRYAAVDSDGDALPDFMDEDSDNDSIPDSDETLADADNDGLGNYVDSDSDNDFLPDIKEGTADTDADGDGNWLDRDSDGDGIPDIIEGGTGAKDDDHDGIANLFDASLSGLADSNGDGIADIVQPLDSDADLKPDYLDSDSDNDRLPDTLEATSSHDSDADGIDDAFDSDRLSGIDNNGDDIDDSLAVHDTDGDNLADYLDTDSDNDGIGDIIESRALLADSNTNGLDDAFDVAITGGTDSNVDGILEDVIPDTDSDGAADHRDLDSDNDSLPDVLESAGTDANLDALSDVLLLTSAPLPDNDADTLPDYRDTDSDNDGTFDLVFTVFAALDTNLDGRVDLSGDSDADGIDDRVDTLPQAYGLLPFSARVDLDLDNDNISNLEEGPADGDTDSLPNWLDNDSDNDGINDLAESGTPAQGGDSNYNGLDDSIDVLLTGGNDADGDGVDDAFAPVDSDGDGTADYLDSDSDDDSIADVSETAADTDSDGIANYLDTDSDNDDISDAEEGSNDHDGDGDANFLDTDSDADGIPDNSEGLSDPDGDGYGNFIDADSDNDAIVDATETATDSDGDSLPDFLDEDSDNDGLSDAIETAADPDSDSAGNYVDRDSDNDFLPDAYEGQRLSDADLLPDYLDNDSDNDSLPDLAEGGTGSSDSDNDGVANRFDVSTTGGPDANADGIDDNAQALDSDNDQIADYIDTDSDGDHIPDIIEAPFADSDGDNLADYLDTDSDNDGIGDITESHAILADSNANGIDDAFDAAVTAGVDDNGDGILDDVLADMDGDSAPDHLDLDTDNDSLPDVLESGGTDNNHDALSDLTVLSTLPLPDRDLDNAPDYRDTDSNNDGIYDILYSNQAAFDGNGDGRVDITADFDQDGIDDKVDTLPQAFGLAPMTQPYNLDLDKDNISNIEEGTNDSDRDGVINRIDQDSDNDGISDLHESGISARIGDSNNNGLDDGIDALLTGGEDTNADGVEDRYAPIDTDGDTMPDYLDTDADNDGVGDLEETGNVVAGGTDVDGDGIDDVFDADQTGGADADSDGIDDAIVLLADTDHDGTPNHLDTDSDNDGFLDGIENDDTNNDGIPDRLQAEGKIKGSSGSGSSGFAFLLLLVSLLALRLPALRNTILPCALLAPLALPVQAEEEYVCRDYLLKPSTTSKGFSPCFYVGAGFGITRLEPDTGNSSWETADDSDSGSSVYGGYHFARDWFAELQYVDLGQASLASKHLLLTSEETIGYQAFSATIGYYLPFEGIAETELPFNIYLKAGIAHLNYDASSALVKLAQDSEMVPALGAGIEMPFLNNRWSIRGGIDNFSAEAAYVSLSAAWWFGGATYHWVPTAPVAAVEAKTTANETASATIMEKAKPEKPVTAEPEPVIVAGAALAADPDLDGVFDPTDECPHTPPKTRVDRKGCARYTGYIQSLYGAFNSTDLTYPSYGALDTIILLLKTYPDTRIEIQAHTDDRGTTGFNQTLSEQRAEVVKQYLVEKGIDASRIEAYGYGESKPLGSNETQEGRSKNRRIDFNVLGR